VARDPGTINIRSIVAKCVSSDNRRRIVTINSTAFDVGPVEYELVVCNIWRGIIAEDASAIVRRPVVIDAAVLYGWGRKALVLIHGRVSYGYQSDAQCYNQISERFLLLLYQIYWRGFPLKQ